MELLAKEFTDNLCLHFGLPPTGLPHTCDGYSTHFTVDNAMTCKKGGLILLSHNNLQGEWHHLCTTVLTPSTVTDEPFIHSGQNNEQEPAMATETAPELHGNVAAHGFWSQGTTTIFDIWITDMDVPSYQGMDPTKILCQHEKEKKDKKRESID